ncbi:hypothetical protein [Pedobacter helvus]|uniref:Lipoprotein n=1 Tax=Pedobacter helvus TaxID=2563444 RepID=A0ABW9JEH1_9SPHI|nr:hypothetical protein [Pedobacter ureilyticus]
MKNITCLLLSISLFGCSRSKTSSQIAKEFYNESSKVPMIYFKNWNFYSRDDRSNQYIICDYLRADKIVARFILNTYGAKFYLKGVFPVKDKDFLLIDDYPKETLQNLYIDRTDFKKGINFFYLLKLNKVLYRNDFDGLIIVKENLNFVFSFSDKLKSQIPEGYKVLGNNWYYYSQ